MRATFDVDVATEYIVRCHMTENFFDFEADGIGKRLFDIEVDDQLVADDVDLLALTQAKSTVVMMDFEVTTTSPKLNVVFRKVAENPLVNAIEVFPKG